MRSVCMLAVASEASVGAVDNSPVTGDEHIVYLKFPHDHIISKVSNKPLALLQGGLAACVSLRLARLPLTASSVLRSTRTLRSQKTKYFLYGSKT